MLIITRTQPTGSAVTSFLDASVSLRDGYENVDGCPDLVFSMKTYQKIAKDNEEQEGDSILLPINLFFETLTFADHHDIYAMYRFAKHAIGVLTMDNRHEIQKALQERIFDTMFRLDLPAKLIAFCRTPRFIYPDLTDAGTLPHHSPAKTYNTDEYIQITAISLVSKMMVPIWGELIKKLDMVGIGKNQKEKMAFDLIEPTLEEGAFEYIYNKLSYTVSTLVELGRAATDKKNSMTGMKISSFIITHNSIDDQIFDTMVMASIIVKRMATYECFVRLNDKKAGANVFKSPNAMVYIDDGIKRTAESKLQSMRNDMNMMPRRPLPDHDTEDNSSILDHASRTSKKPIDVPVFVVTAVEFWELPKLVEDTETPKDVYELVADYYKNNGFDISPLCQAMVASFIGTRFGGSKCLGYLPPHLYQRIVILLQVFLIRQDMYDLAALISSTTSPLPLEGPPNFMASRVDVAAKKSDEYQLCLSRFKGYLVKPSNPFLKGGTFKNPPMDRIDFATHIDRMIEWLVRYTHSENMAPVLWDYSKQDNRPVVGEPARYDEKVIRNLCRFYLLFHNGQRPF